ncbi:GPI-anchored cell wall organization protein ecm33 [Xylariomycetidae sp. FL0641]|nr:GPI-anchored cell wall organization protein ecm33 [Xylariomycetidae sp. FL0641]
MYAKELLSAAAALSMVSSVYAVGCDDDTININSAGDAQQIAKCDSVKGNVVIGTQAGPEIDLGGDLTEIGGDLSCENNGLIQSLKSSSLKTIGGSFLLHNVTSLNSLVFTSLGEVQKIDWATLSALPEPTFGTPGITKADSVVIADTFIDVIEGINVDTLADLNLNNNRRLAKFSSSIKSLTNVMQISANGLNATIEMGNLETCANMTISNVTTMTVPSLSVVNGSMRFDSNYFTNFQAPNLTEIQQGDLSFVSNSNVKNISFPQLEKVGGGFTIANNTDLPAIDGFSKLANVGGAIKFRGSFDTVELPELNNVVGTMEVFSTEDIQSSCDKLSELSGGVIQGKLTNCQSEDENANDDTSSAGSGSGSGDSDDKDGAASVAGVSMSTIIGFASFGALMTAFM